MAYLCLVAPSRLVLEEEPMQSIQSELSHYSALAEDIDLAYQVELFVSRLPERTASLRSDAAKQDWKTLGQSARQLRSSSRSYGFEGLASCAAQLASVSSSNCQETEILDSLEELLEICNQVRAGVPESTGIH